MNLNVLFDDFFTVYFIVANELKILFYFICYFIKAYFLLIKEFPSFVY